VRRLDKDRKHSKSRINSVKKTVRKNSQSKEAAMLEKRHAVMVHLLVSIL